LVYSNICVFEELLFYSVNRFVNVIFGFIGLVFLLCSWYPDIYRRHFKKNQYGISLYKIQTADFMQTG